MFSSTILIFFLLIHAFG